MGSVTDRACPSAAFFNGEFIPDLGAEFRSFRIKVLEQRVQQIGQFFGRKVREYFFRPAGVVDEMGQLWPVHRGVISSGRIRRNLFMGRSIWEFRGWLRNPT